jgi:hypothetical protein
MENLMVAVFNLPKLVLEPEAKKCVEKCVACGKPAVGLHRLIPSLSWFTGCKLHLQLRYGSFKHSGEMVLFNPDPYFDPVNTNGKLPGEILDFEDCEAAEADEEENQLKCFCCKSRAVAIFKPYRPRAKWIPCCGQHLEAKMNEWSGKGQAVQLQRGLERQMLEDLIEHDKKIMAQVSMVSAPVVYYDEHNVRRVMCNCGGIATLVVTAKNEDGIIGSGAMCNQCKNLVQMIDPSATWRPLPEPTGVLPINKPSNARPPTSINYGPQISYVKLLHLNQNHWNRFLPVQTDSFTADPELKCEKLGCRNLVQRLVLLEFKGGEEIKPTYFCHMHTQLERIKAHQEGHSLREFLIDANASSNDLEASQNYGFKGVVTR